MNFNFAFIFIGLLKLVVAIKNQTTTATKNQTATAAKSQAAAASPHTAQSQLQPPQQQSQPQSPQPQPRPLQRPKAQMDFLVTPADFDKDEDVNYLVKQLHRPQSIEKFYKSAARIYDDLAVCYAEIQADAKIAEKFLIIMKKLTVASFNEPLTVTNLIFAASKHLRPLFSHKSPPIEEMYATIAKLELEPSRKMIWLMTEFFTSFTLREVNQIQDFIRLISLATLNTENNTPVPSAPKPVKKSAIKLKPSASKTVGHLDISRTSLDAYANRIRITIANALAKMLILLDLFVTDPTVTTRSINLIRRLWNLHLRRVALRENVPFEELDDKWKDPILYRKSAINFSFDDWGPDSVSPEAMAALRKVIETEEKLDKEALELRSSSQNFTRNLWIFFAVFITISILAVVYFYYRRRLQRQQQQKEIDLTSLETESVNEIVSKLEDNIE